MELFGLRWFFTLIRRTVRIRVVNDRRDQIRYHSDRQFIYAILHAHQVAATALSDPNTGALVSRSRDGDLIAPLLESCGCVPIRGSSGRGSKGGASALAQLIRHCQQGHPAVIAVDGPKGPRGKVQKGVAMLSQKANIPILPVVLVARRRWLFAKAWDRMQLPIPFSRLDCRFGDPIQVHEHDDLAAIASQIETSLEQLERVEDPTEAAIARQRQDERAQTKPSVAPAKTPTKQAA
ncbi:lipoprotein [Rhodopirellula sallentina SM41]|uniref:Lipoprotein n=1 Tax=Rhodopirellula sallentina SM41 TaxID=1263870 RepID=M5TXM5_9BACT|nr:lipoprotein [Rhodopirellula sallentina SM41]